MKNILDKSKVLLCLLLAMAAVFCVTSCGEKKNGQNLMLPNVKEETIPQDVKKAADVFFSENREAFVKKFVDKYFEGCGDWPRSSYCAYFIGTDGITAYDYLLNTLIENDELFYFEVVGKGSEKDTYKVTLNSIDFNGIAKAVTNGYSPSEDCLRLYLKDSDSWIDDKDFCGNTFGVAKEKDISPLSSISIAAEKNQILMNVYIMGYITEKEKDMSEHIVPYSISPELEIKISKDSKGNMVCETVYGDFAEGMEKSFVSESFGK